MFPLGEIARIVGGRLIGDPDRIPVGVIHDSRLVREGDLFVALPGERTDGHLFVADALSRGACGAIVSRPLPGGTLIVVEETLTALQALARAWRERLTSTIIAITGSNGKTTTRDLLSHILAAKMRVYSSPENYNTEVGLPIALLGMKKTDEIGVFELATGSPGDIPLLAGILRPDGAVITGVGPSHLGSFGSIEAVAEEKWSLAASLKEGSLLVVNADSVYLRSRIGKEAIAVGIEHGDTRGRVLQEVPRLIVEVPSPRIVLDSPLLGAHNATNLLLATVTALRLGIPIGTIIERAATFSLREHRLRPIGARFGTILDDTYNANPASTLAAIRVLSRFGGEGSKRIFVFGEMLDLGEDSPRYHRKVVEEALRLGIDRIYPVGDRPTAASRESGTDRAVYSRPEDLVRTLSNELSGPDDVVLVKGSRALALERIVDRLRSL